MRKYPTHASQTDRAAAAALVTECLKGGNTLSVYDGEEWCLKYSTNKLDVLKALSSTGEDNLRVSSPDGTRLGSFYLIYHNGSTPMELIADHSANDYCEGVWNAIAQKLDL